VNLLEFYIKQKKSQHKQTMHKLIEKYKIDKIFGILAGSGPKIDRCCGCIDIDLKTGTLRRTPYLLLIVSCKKLNTMFINYLLIAKLSLLNNKRGLSHYFPWQRP
jgi:hypothetical protein